MYMEEGVKMDWISVNSGWGTMTKKKLHTGLSGKIPTW